MKDEKVVREEGNLAEPEKGGANRLEGSAAPPAEQLPPRSTRSGHETSQISCEISARAHGRAALVEHDRNVKRALYALATALLQQLHPKTNRPLQQPYYKQRAYASCLELM
eukprot:superscaffoldBa00003342_g16699